MNTVEAKKEIERLSNEINRHNYLYYVESKPELSDFALATTGLAFRRRSEVTTRGDAPSMPISRTRPGRESLAVSCEPQLHTSSARTSASGAGRQCVGGVLGVIVGINCV